MQAYELDKVVKYNFTSGKQFAVVYGAMPSKASLFNEKGDQLFDFGTDHKNMALYNQQGNILMIAGFGNLRNVIILD